MLELVDRRLSPAALSKKDTTGAVRGREYNFSILNKLHLSVRTLFDSGVSGAGSSNANIVDQNGLIAEVEAKLTLVSCLKALFEIPVVALQNHKRAARTCVSHVEIAIVGYLFRRETLLRELLLGLRLKIVKLGL